MMFAHKPVLLLLPLCFSLVLMVLKFLLSPSQDVWELPCCPVFTYAVLNAIIFTILLDNGYGGIEQEENLAVVLFAYEMDEERRAEATSEKLNNGYDEKVAESDIDNDGNNKGEYHSSNVDNDHKGSEYESEWEDKEESDAEFERRTEQFIAKVVEGWRVERLKEKVGFRSIDGYALQHQKASHNLQQNYKP